MQTELIHSYSTPNLQNVYSTITSISSLGSLPKLLKKRREAAAREQENKDNNAIVKGPSHTHTGGGGGPRNYFQWLKGRMRTSCLKRKFPILAWLPQYTLNTFMADLIAGVTLGTTVIAQALAISTVAGLPPQYGLYSGYVGCFVYIILGTSPPITIGPTPILSLIALTYAKGKGNADYAILLCFFTGIVTTSMGILQLGFLSRFISLPVSSAFNSAAAITICSLQLKSLVGLKFSASEIVPIIVGIYSRLNQVRGSDIVVSLTCIFVLLFLRKLQSFFGCDAVTRSPFLQKFLWVVATSKGAIVIITSAALFAAMGDESIVHFVGKVEPGLPPLRFPSFTFDRIGDDGEVETVTLSTILTEDSTFLFVVPLLALMEHFACVHQFSATNHKIDAEQEMLALGVTNILGSCVSSMPVAGAFARSVLNKASGVRTTFGGFITGIMVLFAIQFMTPLFYFIPRAAIAATVFIGNFYTIDFGIIPLLWKCKKLDLIPWFLTFSVCLVAGLQYGVIAGSLTSIIFLLYWSAASVVKVKRAKTADGTPFVILTVDRSCTFMSVQRIVQILLKSKTAETTKVPIVIDCHHVQFTDYTAAKGIQTVFKIFNEGAHPLILYRMKPSIAKTFVSLLEINDAHYKTCEDEIELERAVKGFSFSRRLE